MLVRTSYKVEKVIVYGFLLVILAGALLLFACNNFYYGMRLSLINALFMSTSAVCVTGLQTVNIATDFGFWSQVILLALIETGGLGFMTGMMVLPVVIGRRIGIRSRIFFLGGLGLEGVQGAVKLFKVVVGYTLCVEAAGAAALFWGFRLRGEGAARSLYNAVFHSVSAFCNAGFSTYADGLDSFSASLLVPGVIMLLIVLGGIGFPVVAELGSHYFGSRRDKVSYYPMLVFFITFWLILAGTVLILVSDWNVAFKGMPAWERLWNALFASVTTRTAGFDTVPPASFSGLGQAIMIILMVIGASPASTGGGIKTTTFGVLAISVWNELRGRGETTFFHRKLSQSSERRALALVSVYIITMLAGAIALSAIENMPFNLIIYEAASAIGTVGLSAGITSKLTAAGKIILMALMFWGRVGILSFFAALVKPDEGEKIHYAETHIPLG